MHPIIGIDVGKAGLHVAFPPPDSKTHPRHWPHIVISYDDPRWWETLIDLVAENAIIAAEPTGTHLLSPVAAVIHSYRPSAQLWQVGHKQTERHRETHVSSAKNDRLDAITLALIARDISLGNPPRDCRPYNHILESSLTTLRTFVNIHARLMKERTRALNRINVLAHSLMPSFPRKLDTWLRAVRAHHAVTPAQIKALAQKQPPPPPYQDGRIHRHLQALAATLPDVAADPTIADALLALVEHLDSIQLQLADVESRVTHLIEQPPLHVVTRRWRTIPNSNDVQLAALHVATHAQVLDMTKDEFRAAVGVNPRTSISGDIDRTRQSRKGYRPARTAMYMWTLNLCSPNSAPNPVRDYYSAEGRSFAAARNKLARVLWGVARNPHL